MCKEFRKISRGQVWFIVDPDIPAVHYRDSVQGKNRPWLIVSNDKNNQNSSIFTAVPLTTATKTKLPVHVNFKVGELEQIVLCEQLRTMPIRLIENSGSNYKFTLSEEIMQKVDEALAVQLGLSLVMPNADRFWKSIESMIRIKVKDIISNTKVDSCDISKIVAMLDIKTDEVIVDGFKPIVQEKQEPQFERVSDAPEQSKVPKTNDRFKWTTSKKKEFLDDCYKHDIDWVAKTYGLPVTTIRIYKYKFAKEVCKNASTSQG